MDLKQLEYFTEIVRCQSLNKAAKNLFISQTALTKSMNVMEEELGLKLLNRSRQGVTVTEIGEQIYKDALQIIATRKHWNVYHHAPVYAEIHVAVTPSVCSTIINVITSEIFSSSKYINIIPLETYAVDMQETLYRSTVRLGIMFSHDKADLFPTKEVEKNGLKKTYLYHDYYRVYVNVGHPLAQQKSVHIDDLKKYRAVMMNPDEYLNDILFEHIAKEECYITNNYRVHFFMIFLEDYFTIWPSMVAQYNRFPVTGEVKVLPIVGIPEELLRIDYFLIHPPLAACSNEEKQFIAQTTTFCQNISPQHYNDVRKPYGKK